MIGINQKWCKEGTVVRWWQDHLQPRFIDVRGHYLPNIVLFQLLLPRHPQLWCTVHSDTFLSESPLTFSAHLINSSLLGLDHTGQPLHPWCINEPWLPMAPSLVHHCSLPGPLSTGSDHWRLGIPHKSSSFRDALIQLSDVAITNWPFVKLTQILCLYANFPCI